MHYSSLFQSFFWSTMVPTLVENLYFFNVRTCSIRTYQACKARDEWESDFLSISSFGKAIKLTENILHKTRLLVRMVDWILLKCFVSSKHPYHLPNNFKKHFLPNIHNTDTYICSRYNRTHPKEATCLYTLVIANENQKKLATSVLSVRHAWRSSSTCTCI